MAKRRRIHSVMVEFHRLGGPSGVIRRGERYIRTTGWDEPACEIPMELDHGDFVNHLNTLRYDAGITLAEVGQALSTLSAQAARMLPELPELSGDETIQIDLVAGAAELWAFPFEACCDNCVPRFARSDRRLVLTRRIRAGFAERAMVWPSRPRILFAHAAIGSDLEKELVVQHVDALKDALRPWKGGKEPDASLLVVRELYSLADLSHARDEAGEKGFTHIHVLAHGQPVADRKVRGHSHWGLRLGTPGSEAVEPETLAQAMAPHNGLPVVVTVASCDSGNQADPAIPRYSLAQELHRCGIPVVVASQLPLTKPGSVLLARCFYEPLLRGEDARSALHDLRSKLHQAGDAGHDWLSLVAYVRLPEGYAEHLAEVGLRTELAMLNAAQRRLDPFITRAEPGDELAEVDRLVRERIVSLDERLEELDRDPSGLRQECQGLLASAHKRLAELLFLAARWAGEKEQEQRLASRQALEAALRHYRAAFRSNIQMHWQGVQQLALEAVLHGRSENPIDWSTVLRGAELTCEGNPKEYWALGTLAELHLLGPVVGKPTNIEAARQALEKMKAVTRDCGDEGVSAIESTRRQLARYVNWWTKENGFLPDGPDLAQDAGALVRTLS